MAQEPKRGPGRPRKDPLKAVAPRPDLLGGDHEADRNDREISIRANVAGVSIDWLSHIFRMDRRGVQKRLAACPVLRRGSGDIPLFDIAQAASYLTKPKIDVGEWVKSLRPADLPPFLQNEFWDAQNKRQKWEENAGDLWRTEKVVEVFADVFKLIKETMQLWTDSIERKEGMTGEQRKLLSQMIDGLQDELYKKLVDFSKLQKTPNSAAELKDIEKAEPPRERRPVYSNVRPDLV